MPCSSYLTSQSSYISNFNGLPDAIKPFWPDEWKKGFGRSPECASYAEVWRNQGRFTFSSCGSNDAIVPASQGIVLPHQIPPGVLRQIPSQVYECCGNCTLDISEVRLYYFRDETGNSSYCQANQTFGSQNTPSTASNEKRAHSIPTGSSIAIVSGYTFTSPSVYLEIVGTAAVADSCAPLGAVLTNPIVAVPPGVLMTYSPQFPFTIGEKYFDPNGVIGAQFLGFKKSLNIAELECPTFGVGLATSADGRVYQTYGPPYLPIIIPPQQILSLDPAWEKYCVDYVSYSPGLPSFAIFDPPRILTPVAALIPPLTSTPAIISASRTPDPVLTKESQIQPARTTPPTIPKATVVPVASGLPPPESRPSLSVPVNEYPPTSDPEQVADPEEQPQSLGKIIYNAFGRGDPLTGGSANQVSTLPVPRPDAHEFTADGQKATIVDHSEFVIGGNTYSAGGAAATLSNGMLSIIPPAEAGNGDTRIDGFHSTIIPSTPKVLTVASQIFTANPSEIVIAGTTLLPDGPGIVISGTPISLAPSGNLFLDGSIVPLANDLSPPPSFVFKIGDQTATANPAGFILASSRIVPGSAQVTIFGTPVSLNPSGILFIGGSSINLLGPTPTPAIFTIGDKTVTANPAGFVLAGSKLVPGGTPITISGTPVSLNPSGVLFIGSSSTNLLAPTPSSKTFTIGGHTFTAQSTGFELAGSTLLPGGAAVTISGTPISLGPSGVLIIGSSSIDLPVKSFASHVFTAGGLTLTAELSAIVVDGTTLVPGGPAATVSGTPISLKAGKSSGVLIIGTSTINLPAYMPAYTLAPNILTAGGLTFTSESSAIVVDGTTLLPGGPGATVSGTPISLKAGKDSETLIVGTSTINLPTHASGPNIFTIGGLTFTSQPSAVVIDGSTLVPGGSGVTISGTLVSLEPGGRSLLVGSREVPLATSSPTAGGSATLLAFEGGQSRSIEIPRLWRVAGSLGALYILFLLGSG